MNSKQSSSDNYLNILSTMLNQLNREQIDNAVKQIANVWEAGKPIITLGKRCSSKTTLHFINDWNKSIFSNKKSHFLDIL